MLAVAAALTTLSLTAAAAPNDTHNITLYWENDAFADTDRDYTSGLKLTWSSALPAEASDNNLVQRTGHALINHLPFINYQGLRRGMALSIGHSIYTPADTQRRDLIEDDRPYAGFLYGGIGLFAYNDRRMSMWEFNFGVVGPSALGEQVQNQTHDWLSVGKAQGWDNQLSDEPAVGVISETKWRLWQWESANGWGSSWIVHLGGRLGNVAIYANSGSEIRFGWHPLTDFGSCPIRPGCDTNHVEAWNQGPDTRTNPFGFAFFAAADGRWVLHDIFLDGNTSGDSHSVTKEPLVADLMAGVVFHVKKVRFSYAYVLRTRQFEEQPRNQIFGAFTVSATF